MQLYERKSDSERVPPTCEECGVELERYYGALDTGADGWRCPSCGWTWDD